MKHTLFVSLATSLLVSSAYSLAVKNSTAPAVIHFPISKRNASPAETTLSRRQAKRRVLTQILVNSVIYYDDSK